MELKAWVKVMIKKIISILVNPGGALVQTVLDILIKQFNLDQIEGKLTRALKYVDEPNECDMGLDAIKDMVISQQREIDEIKQLIKGK